jgi:hypothetical protein
LRSTVVVGSWMEFDTMLKLYLGIENEGKVYKIMPVLAVRQQNKSNTYA